MCRSRLCRGRDVQGIVDKSAKLLEDQRSGLDQYHNS